MYNISCGNKNRTPKEFWEGKFNENESHKNLNGYAGIVHVDIPSLCWKNYISSISDFCIFNS